MKIILRSLLPFLVVFICLGLYSQEKFNAREYFVEAESYFLFEEYADALPLYQRILREEPENFNVTYKIGICYLNDPYQKHRSIQYLSKAADHINNKYRTNSYKEKLAPPEVNYYLGQAYRINNQIDQALESYARFKQNIDPEIFDIEVVNLEMEACERAKESVKNPVYLTRDNFGNDINTRFAETNAVLSGDGKTLIFNRELQFYNAVFITTKDKDGKWSPAYNLTPDFGVDGNSYCTGISFYGDEILVYRSDDFDGNIYSSKKVNGKWQKLERLGYWVNTKYWESHASFSPDGQYLYFTSNRKGGYGGLDIYKSKKLPNGTWGEPVNLGPMVNSPYNEDSPFISPSDQSLYFSSAGHNSIGGYDVFISKLIGPGKWSRPINMGFPFNTPDDDMYFCPIDSETAAGIRSAYEPQSTLGLRDIYWIKVFNEIIPRPFTLKGEVGNPLKNIMESGEVVISLIDTKAGKIIQQVTPDGQGAFSLTAQQGEYQLLVDGEQIKPVTIPVTLDVVQKDSEVELPLITAELLAKGEEKERVVIAQPAMLELVGENYIITDSVPVEINLKVTEGSAIAVERFASGKKLSRYEYLAPKKQFSYKFAPKEGDNRLVFYVKDPNGLVNQKEVSVYYEPGIEEQTIAEEADSPTNIAGITTLANGGLKEYLLSLQSLDYSSLAELYNMLTVNSAANGYTEEDVEDLIQVLLTQRDMEEFVADIRDISKLGSFNRNDSLIDVSEYPLSLVRNGKEQDKALPETIDLGLIATVPYRGNNSGMVAYIASFLDEIPTEIEDRATVKSDDEIFGLLNSLYGEANASRAIETSSTTENLDQFYNNLIMSADETVRLFLSEINFDSLGIDNAIDLVSYLFDNAETMGMTVSDVVELIDKAQKDKDKNLNIFKESLANAATGELKRRLHELDNEAGNVDEFEDVLEALIRDSKINGYSQAEVYDLLINMLGFTNVGDFIQAVKKHSQGEFDGAIDEMNIGEYSLPVEVIQYLLTKAPYFDYTDSDINNLLIKMLLEQGLDSWKTAHDETYSNEFVKKRRFITTLILLNLLIVVIIFLVARKKKKKE